MSKDIRELIFESPLFDNHEHLLSLPKLGAQEDTYLSFVGYAATDLEVSLGPKKPKVTAIPSFPSSRTPEFDRMFFSAWKRSRNTGYCRATETACRDILGLEYREENVEAIGKKLEALKGGDPARLMEDVIKGKAGIRWAVTDAVNMPDEIGEGVFPSFVHANYRDDPLLVAPNRDTILEREARWDRSIHCLDDLLEGFMESISGCLATGRVTSFKIGLAYSRGLDFGFPTKAEAEKAFNRLMYVKSGEKVLRANERLGVEPGRAIAIPLLSGEELRPLHDYLVHRYIQRASDEGKPVH
jgi:hypothetical protein